MNTINSTKEEESTSLEKIPKSIRQKVDASTGANLSFTREIDDKPEMIDEGIQIDTLKL